MLTSIFPDTIFDGFTLRVYYNFICCEMYINFDYFYQYKFSDMDNMSIHLIINIVRIYKCMIVLKLF